MSLINDALRKARQAASEHAAEKSEEPFRGPRLHPARRSRHGSGLAAIIVIAAAAALVGASASWWAASRQNARNENSETLPAASAPASELPHGASPQSASPPARDTGGPASQKSQATETSATEQAPLTEATPAPSSEPPPKEAQTAPSPSTAGRAAALPHDELSGGSGGESSPLEGTTVGDRVFVVDANLGYASLSLDYIAFRPDDPFAEINGTVVHEGWRVEGFVVEAIERDRVLLRDEKGPLVLKVQ